MHLFRCRPLALACAFFIFSLLAAYLLPLSVSFAFCLAFGGIWLIILIWSLLRGWNYRRLFLLLAFLGIFLGSARVIYEQWVSEKNWQARYTQTQEMEFSVAEILYSSAYGGELLVDIHVIGGEEVDSRAVLRSETQLPLYVGDRACAVLRVEALDYEAYADNAAYRYQGDGAKALLLLEDADTLCFLSSGTDSLRTRLLDLRAVLSHRISRTVGGEKGKLLAAMLLGSKNLLSAQTVRDFGFSGVSHLLALSGLHLVILAGLIERLLYFLGLGKRARVLILLPLCFFYLMLTGCNYSLLRALIMLGSVYLSSLLREDHDSLTALLLAGSAILLFSPYAIFSVSFQMTVLATFGILAFVRIQALLSSRLPSGKSQAARIVWRAVRFVCSSLLLSLSTTVALLPVLWLEIGAFSLITPLSNLVLVPLAPLILFSAVLVLILPFSFVGSIAGVPATLALLLVKSLGATQAIISLQEPYIPFLVIPVILVTAVLLIIDLKKLYPLAILPAAVCMLGFLFIFFVMGGLDQSLSVTYRQSGKNEGLILARGSQAMICDLSTTTLTQLRADWRAAQDMGATELSLLLLTHYHSKSAVALSRFTQEVLLRELWLPRPQDESDRDICADLLRVALERDLQVTLYDTKKPLTVFDTGKLTLSERYDMSRSVEPAFFMTLCYGESSICYHTAALGEYMLAHDTEHICAATHVILGAHGPVPKKATDLAAVAPQSIVVGNEEHLAFYTIHQASSLILSPAVCRYELE